MRPDPENIFQKALLLPRKTLVWPGVLWVCASGSTFSSGWILSFLPPFLPSGFSESRGQVSPVKHQSLSRGRQDTELPSLPPAPLLPLLSLPGSFHIYKTSSDLTMKTHSVVSSQTRADSFPFCWLPLFFPESRILFGRQKVDTIHHHLKIKRTVIPT